MWVPHENIITWKFCQLHIIEIIVHVLPIMTSYSAIAISLLVLQRQLDSVQIPSSKTQSSVPDPCSVNVIPALHLVIRTCPSHSQLMKPCTSFPCMSMATVEIEKDSVWIPISLRQMIATELGLCGLHIEVNCHQAIFAWNIVSESNKWITMCINFPKQSNKHAQYVWRASNNFHRLIILTVYLFLCVNFLWIQLTLGRFNCSCFSLKSLVLFQLWLNNSVRP